MKTLLTDNYPESDPQLTYPSVIIHDRGRKRSQKLVIMMEADFFELLKKIHGTKSTN